MPVFEIVEGECCGTCKHFREHYVRIGERYHALRYGHCVFPRVKRRAAEGHCPKWAAAEEDGAGVPDIYCLLHVRGEG